MSFSEALNLLLQYIDEFEIKFDSKPTSDIIDSLKHQYKQDKSYFRVFGKTALQFNAELETIIEILRNYKPHDSLKVLLANRQRIQEAYKHCEDELDKENQFTKKIYKTIIQGDGEHIPSYYHIHELYHPYHEYYKKWFYERCSDILATIKLQLGKYLSEPIERFIWKGREAELRRLFDLCIINRVMDSSYAQFKALFEVALLKHSKVKWLIKNNNRPSYLNLLYLFRCLEDRNVISYKRALTTLLSESFVTSEGAPIIMRKLSSAYSDYKKSMRLKPEYSPEGSDLIDKCLLAIKTTSPS